MFMRWREWLNHFIMEDRGNTGDEAAKKIGYMGATNKALEKAWEDGHYDDQSVPINVLMNHSDCNGEIAIEVCGPLADALEGLLKYMPERGGGAYYEEQATLRFIRGLREAAAANDPV